MCCDRYEHFDINSDTEFIWDNIKEEINFKKHGIKFSTASKVFKDEKKLIRLDEEHTEEERYNVLGKVGKLLFVVVTFREENKIRIISARKANKYETRRYSYDDEN